uniref:Uncharacterized protein n=1 Tax=Oryza glumipatula TaxID=40148 RepID=A0A0D9Z8Y7_9ORYZ
MAAKNAKSSAVRLRASVFATATSSALINNCSSSSSGNAPSADSSLSLSSSYTATMPETSMTVPEHRDASLQQLDFSEAPWDESTTFA